MTSKTKQLLSTILALAMVFGVFVALPMTASAADRNLDVISNSTSVAGLKQAIDTALSQTNPGEAVIVTGSKTNADGTLTLNIPSDRRVLWKADYRGDITTPLITLTGGGTFEVEEGGAIRATGAGSAINATGDKANINVSGGTVSAISTDAILTDGKDSKTTVSGSGTVSCNTGRAIHARGASSSVTVSGGTITSASQTAIWAPDTGSSVSISGGMVSSGGAVATITANGSFIMSGGTARNTGTADAVLIFNANISGGTISSKSLSAVYAPNNNAQIRISGGTMETTGTGLCHAVCTGGTGATIDISGGTFVAMGTHATVLAKGAGSTVKVNGGFVFGLGTGVIGENNVIHAQGGTPAIGGMAVVCAWKRPGGTPTYMAGATTDLFISPSAATVKWGKNGSQTGINYANGLNTGFLPLSGATVNEAPVRYMYIGNSSGVGLASNQNGVGWSWVAATKTLTLTSSYTGQYIDISCADADTINLVYSGNVTIANDTGHAVNCTGSLNVTGSSGTLTINSHMDGIGADGNMTISSGNITINSDMMGINGIGNVTISGGTLAINAGQIGIGSSGSITFSGGSGTIKTSGGAGFCAVAARADITVKSGMQVKGWDGAAYTVPQAINRRTVYGENVLTFTTPAFPDTGSPNIQFGPGSGAGGMANFIKSRDYTPGQFSDVNENEWYGWNGLKFIGTAYEYGLVNGYAGSDRFGPTDDFTVAQAIALAARINSIYWAGADLQQGEPWYQVFVDYALANGIILQGDFPDIHRAATRAEMAYIFSRCLPDSEFAQQNTVNSLPDVNASTPYRDSIFLLYKAGVLTGNNAQGEFTPGDSMTRAMAAGIAMRIILPSTRESGKTYG